MQLLAPLLALLLGGCATLGARSDMTVPEVLANWEELDGKTLNVRGWMGECWNMTCELYSSSDLIREEAHKKTRSLTLGRKSREFDALLNSYRGKEIVVRGRFDDSCLGESICLDRASALEPIRVVRVVSPASNK